MSEHEQNPGEGGFQSQDSAKLAAELTVMRQKTEQQPSAEVQTPGSQLRRLLSDQGRRELTEDVARGLADPEVQQVIQLKRVSDGLMDRQERGEITYEEADEEARKIREELYGPLREATLRSGQLTAQQEALGKGRVELYGERADVEAQQMISYATNVDTTNVAHAFINPDKLKPYESAAYDTGNTLTLKTSDTIEVPLGMFVSASGFESWRGRREGVLKDRRPSSEVIDDYAERTTTPPPVEQLTGYVLPDGRVYFKTENSHRVAAAIKRGDSHIQVNGRIRVNLLDEVPPGL